MMRTCVLLALLAALVRGETGSNITDFVKKYAPRLRFDSTAGSDAKCFPSSAEDYYQARLDRDHSRICNLNYTSVVNHSVPTYWHAQRCGPHLHVAYWSFYGFNDNCDCCSGSRDAWFESLVMKVRNFDNQTAAALHEVRFGQKGGWYTRVPGHYETTTDGHPVAYVGKSSHGFYHDAGGSGTCCYYEDFRNPTSADMHMDTWNNLVEFDNATQWMNEANPVAWEGIYGPRFRSDWDLCKLNGCSGADVQLCEDSGCHKSDTSDHPF